MAGEILPDSHVRVLDRLSNYLGELEEAMDGVGDNLSTKNKSPMVRQHRNKQQSENKQCRRQRRHFRKPTSQILTERQHRYPAGFRHCIPDTDNSYHNPYSVRYSENVGYAPCEGNNYFTYPSSRNKDHYYRKVKQGVLKANDGNEIENRQAFEGSSETNVMKIIQDEMMEMKDKLSTVVETLSNVVEALLKTVGEENEPGRGDERLNGGASEVGVLDFGVEQKLEDEKAVQFEEDKVKSKFRGRNGFCCLRLRPVESTGSDSDYYRPQRPHNSQSKLERTDHRKTCLDSSVSECKGPGEIPSSESHGSRVRQRVTLCYLFQKFFYRAKLLFF